MRWTRAGARLPLLLAVLAGLFLMHGLSAASGAGCHGAAMPAPPALMSPAPMSPVMSEPATAASSGAQRAQPMAAPESAQGADFNASSQNPASHAGETCVPLRPKELAGFALVLFMVLPWPGAAARLRNRLRGLPPWPDGPPRARGIDLLTGICLSRT